MVRTLCISIKTGRDRGSVYTGLLDTKPIWVRTADLSSNDSHKIQCDPERCRSVRIGVNPRVNTKDGPKHVCSHLMECIFFYLAFEYFSIFEKGRDRNLKHI